MTELSPAAQAVLDAYKEASDGHYIDGEWVQNHPGQVAAALRAAAVEIILPKYQYADWEMADCIMKEFQAVADELEVSDD